MNPTKVLHNLGQSLWLDNITRELLNSGTLQCFIDEFSVTGLTSNPTIFDHAIKNSPDYDSDIARLSSCAKSVEDLFFELAFEDLTRAADLLQPIFARTKRVDGWVSLEVSPFLTYDTQRTIKAARDLSERGRKSTSSLKFRARKRDCRQSRRRSLLVSRSMSRFWSRGSNISARRKPACVESSGASKPV
jgi:transaldolase